MLFLNNKINQIILICLSILFMFVSGLPHSINYEDAVVISKESRYKGKQVVSSKIYYSPTIKISSNKKIIQLPFKEHIYNIGETIRIYEKNGEYYYGISKTSIFISFLLSLMSFLLFVIGSYRRFVYNRARSDITE
jgi:hypothetical protein